MSVSQGGTDTGRSTKRGDPVQIIAFIVIVPIIVFVVLFVGFGFYFSGENQVAHFDGPGSHSLDIYRSRDFDLAQGYTCVAKGSVLSHETRYFAAIGSGQLAPEFIFHSKGSVVWLTVNHRPTEVLYMADFSTGERWPGAGNSEDESAMADRLVGKIADLSLVLHQSEWIGIEKPRVP